jgi:hypothetical protein
MISGFRTSFRINICAVITFRYISISRRFAIWFFLYIFPIFPTFLDRLRLRLITLLLRRFYILIWKFGIIFVRIEKIFAAKIRRYTIYSRLLLIRNSYLNIVLIILSRRYLPYYFKNSGSQPRHLIKYLIIFLFRSYRFWRRSVNFSISNFRHFSSILFYEFSLIEIE